MCKKLLYLCLALILISQQSCFEIIEEIVLKNDGSGSLQLIANFSKSKSKIMGFEKSKTVNGKPVPSRAELKSKIKETEDLIKSVSGISNVSTQTDFDNYILTFNCNFKNVQALNDVVKKIGAETKVDKKYINKFYDYQPTTKTFSRLYNINLLPEYNKMSAADKEVFYSSTYTIINRFEGDVKSVTNTDCKIAGSKKATMLKHNILDIIQNKKSIANNIKLN